MNIKIHFLLFVIQIQIHAIVVVLLLLHRHLGYCLEEGDYSDLILNFLNLMDSQFHPHFHFQYHRLRCLRFPYHFPPHRLIPCSLRALLLLLLVEVALRCFRLGYCLLHFHRECHLVLDRPFCLKFYLIKLYKYIYYLFNS